MPKKKQRRSDSFPKFISVDFSGEVSESLKLKPDSFRGVSELFEPKSEEGKNNKKEEPKSLSSKLKAEGGQKNKKDEFKSHPSKLKSEEGQKDDKDKVKPDSFKVKSHSFKVRSDSSELKSDPFKLKSEEGQNNNNKNDSENTATSTPIADQEALTAPPPFAMNTVEFRDHYTLGRSTTLRFRGKVDETVHILDNVGSDQQLVVVMKETVNERGQITTTSVQPEIQSKGAFGRVMVRTIAALVSLFILTCWVAFSIQCVFFLFMNVVGTYTQEEWTSNPPILSLLGCVAACPLLVDSLAKILTMSLACTVDCWRGIAIHPFSLWKTNSRLGFHAEWPILMIFFAIPLLTLFVSATIERANEDRNPYDDQDGNNDEENPRNFYEITMLAWAGSVWIFQIIYMELSVINEMVSCHKLLKHFRNTKNLLESIKMNVLLTQRQKYSGMRRELYQVENIAGNEADDSYEYSASTRFTPNPKYRPVGWKYALGTRFTKLLPCCYDKLVEGGDTPLADDKDAKPEEEVKRNYTMEEVVGSVRIITKNNWSLEKLWFSNVKRSTYLTVVSGTCCSFYCIRFLRSFHYFRSRTHSQTCESSYLLRFFARPVQSHMILSNDVQPMFFCPQDMPA